MHSIKLRYSATVLISTMLIFILSACGGKQAETTSSLPDGLERYNSRYIGVFDTVTTLVGIAKDQESFEVYDSLIKDELTRLHQLFDTFKSYEGINNLKTVNDQAGIAPVEVDPVVIELLEQAIHANEISNGMVNLALGPVLEIWHDYRDHGQSDPLNAALPSLAELEAANLHTDISKIEIDKENSTVYLPDPKMSLDVGSGSKGLAVELASKLAIEAGFEHFLLSAGGNVKAVGFRDAKSEPWRVGIQHPDENPGEYIDIVYVSDMAVVTSGVYERNYTVDGQSYHHIIHSEHLFPVNHFDAVTLIVPDSGLADSLTTALFNMTLEEGKAFVESIPDAAALWVKDGEITYSTRMHDLLTADVVK